MKLHVLIQMSHNGGLFSFTQILPQTTVYAFLLATYPLIVHFGLILAYMCNSENSGRITGDSDISCIV